MGAYSGVDGHRQMNFDGVRNPLYKQAIDAAVTPESVVLDLGAGLGMLGFLAAGAGAHKVYLVDPEPVIEVTRKIAEANGMTNVECIRAKAETLELPEPVDLILSVFTGNFLLTEDLLPSLFHARDRFLKRGGRLIPDRARMVAAPVSAAAYYQENIENWSLAQARQHGVESYAVDYAATRPYAANSLHYDSARNFKARLLAEPAGLLDMDFMTAKQAACDCDVHVVVGESGTCHGWLGWFDMRLGSEWLSTAPDAPATHWRQVFMPLERPLDLEAGQAVRFRLKRKEYGEWSWVTSTGDSEQRQSTFLSEPLTPEVLRRKTETHQPGLNDRGRALHFLLSQLDGTMSIGALADGLFRKFPQEFISRNDALRFVRSLTDKYAR